MLFNHNAARVKILTFYITGAVSDRLEILCFLNLFYALVYVLKKTSVQYL